MTGRGCDTVLVGRRVVTPQGERPAAVAVQGGRIVAVTRVDRAPAARRTVHLAEDEVLLPGLVDSHVHLQDPGRTDWEDVASASRAAALGGVTTLVDMPLDSDPVTVASVHAKQTALAGRSQVDYGLWGGAVPQSLGRLDGLVAAGVLGFKCFLSPTGIAGFDPLTPAQLRSALGELRPLGVPLLVHAEDETAALPLRGPTPRYDDYLASRPSRVEENAVAHVVAAVAATGGWAHLVHLSAAGSLPLVRAGRDGGGRLTAETAPHYLVLPGQIADGATAAKAMPAVRLAADAEGLWNALRDATVDLVVSDHSPCAPGGKSGRDFAAAAPGVASLQVGLPVLWTEAMRRGHDLPQLVRWICSAPADLAGLPRKGRVAAGADADFCVFAPDEQLTVGPVAHKQPGTPYDGRRLVGVVRQTWLRGEPLDGRRPRGRLLPRSHARAAALGSVARCSRADPA